MTDTPSSILLLRLQSTGSNTNLWGGYLNTALSTLEQAAKGYQALAVTGDATISWTNYSSGNVGQAAKLKLTGTLAAAAALTFPSYQNWVSVWNAAGQTVTVKCSGGTGVAIPNGRKALIYCDGTDYFTDTPTWTGDSNTLSNSGDIVVKSTLEAAIAAATGLTAPFVLISATDTTAGYLGQKIRVNGASVTPSNPAANEYLDIIVDEGQLALVSGVMGL